MSEMSEMSKMKVDLTNVSDTELLKECRKRFIVTFDVGYDDMDGFREPKWVGEGEEEEYDEEVDKKLYEEFKQYCDDDYRIQRVLDRTYDDLMILMKSKWNDFERTKEDEDEDEYDERRNSFEAFNEWFNKEVRSLEDIEKNDEDFNEVVREWCNNNNHEIREDGIYNMNIKIEKE